MTDKKFKILMIVAIVAVVFVYGLPHLVHYVVLNRQGIEYFSITSEANLDAMYVHPGLWRDIIDGNIFPGEIDTYEYKDAPSLWLKLNMLIFAPFLLASKSIFFTTVANHLVFPPLLFLSFFAAIHVLTKKRLWALWISFLVLIFWTLPILLIPSLNNIKVLLVRLFPWPFEYVFSLIFLRVESFLGGGQLFLLFFFSLFKILDDEGVMKKNKKFIFLFLAGLCYGLLFYFYLYFWVFISIFLGILFAIFLFKNRQKAYLLALTAFFGWLVSIPFWFQYFAIKKLPQYADIVARTVGLEISHSFRLSAWDSYIFFFLIIIMLFFLKKKQRISELKFWFISCLCLASIAVYNIQVVTGFNIQPDHWPNRVFLVTNTLILSVAVLEVFKYLRNFLPKIFPYILRDMEVNWGKIIKIIAFVFAAYLFVLTIFSGIVIEKRRASNYVMPENLKQAYDWLGKNTSKDSVVMSPYLKTNVDLPALTSNRIFLARAGTSVSPQDELYQRLYITYKFFNISESSLEEILGTMDGIFYFCGTKCYSTSLDAYMDPKKYGGGYKLPPELKKQIFDAYANYKLPEKMPFRLDYIFVGPREKEIGLDLKNLEDMAKIYDVDGVQIYKFSD